VFKENGGVESRKAFEPVRCNIINSEKMLRESMEKARRELCPHPWTYLFVIRSAVV
jgi:hypothetical protein